jgi:hypothetical protein
VKCIKAETFSLVFSVRIGLSLCWVLVCARYLLARFWVHLLHPEQVLGSPAGLLSQAGHLVSALSEFRWFQSGFLSSVGASTDFCCSFSVLKSCLPTPRWSAPPERFLSCLEQAPPASVYFNTVLDFAVKPRYHCVWIVAVEVRLCS